MVGIVHIASYYAIPGSFRLATNRELTAIVVA